LSMGNRPMYWRAGLPGFNQLAPFGDLPLVSSLDNSALPNALNALYDAAMYADLSEEFFEHSGFFNFGYWNHTTHSQKEASENLVDVLVGLMPDKKGTILDVACGTGASTKRLLRYYDPSDIVGINISEKQLTTCRQRAPGVRFIRMDAADMRFPSESFDNILCVEAVFHFNTRAKFLEEAYRVLKPGGCLALSDFLLRSKYAASLVSRRIPVANFIPSVEEYRSLYERLGFVDVHIVDERARCWEAHRDHQRKFIWDKFVMGRIPFIVLKHIDTRLYLRDWLFKNYLIISAIKPRHGRERNGQRSQGGER
jgi:MPBQ/MSBQ methyltransferase